MATKRSLGSWNKRKDRNGDKSDFKGKQKYANALDRQKVQALHCQRLWVSSAIPVIRPMIPLAKTI